MRPQPAALLAVTLALAAPLAAQGPAPLVPTWPGAPLDAEGAVVLDLGTDKREVRAASDWFPADAYREYALRFAVRDVQIVDPMIYAEFQGDCGPRSEWVWPTDWKPRPPVYQDEETRFLTIGGVKQMRLVLVARMTGGDRVGKPVLFKGLQVVPLPPLRVLPSPQTVAILNAGFEQVTPEGRPAFWGSWGGDFSSVSVVRDGAAEGQSFARLPEGKWALLVAGNVAGPTEGVYRLTAQIRGTGALSFGVRTNWPYSVPRFSNRECDDHWVEVKGKPDQWTPVSAEIGLDIAGLNALIPLVNLRGPADLDDFRLELVAEKAPPTP